MSHFFVKLLLAIKLNPVFKADLLALRANTQMMEAKLEAKVEKVGLELMKKNPKA